MRWQTSAAISSVYNVGRPRGFGSATVTEAMPSLALTVFFRAMVLLRRRLLLRYSSLRVTIRFMKLEKPCEVCQSSLWCGRQCRHAPHKAHTEKKPIPPLPTEKPFARPYKNGESYSKKTALYNHNCVWCGTEFRGSMDRSFCSDTCRVNAWRAKKRNGPDNPDAKFPELYGWARRRFTVLERDGFKCRYCGKGAKQDVVLNVDHINPKSLGGSDEIDNLITACNECNSGKGAKLISNLPD